MVAAVMPAPKATQRQRTRSHRRWTTRQLGDLIRLCLAGEKLRLIALATGKTEKACRCKIQSLAIPYSPQRTPWTRSEEKLVRRYYGEMTAGQIAETFHLCHSEDSIRVKARNLKAQEGPQP